MALVVAWEVSVGADVAGLLTVAADFAGAMAAAVGGGSGRRVRMDASETGEARDRVRTERFEEPEI